MNDGPVVAAASCSDKGYPQTRPRSNLTCGGQYEVLVADDSHRIRELIQTRLKDAGVNVTAVSDGQHARVKIEEHAGIARLAGAGNRQFTPDNLKKGQAVVANLQISKP